MDILRKFALSVLAAIAWWNALCGVAWLAGWARRRSRPQGASELLDAAV